jgi:hypothetical protein
MRRHMSTGYPHTMIDYLTGRESRVIGIATS